MLNPLASLRPSHWVPVHTAAQAWGGTAREPAARLMAFQRNDFHHVKRMSRNRITFLNFSPKLLFLNTFSFAAECSVSFILTRFYS